MYWQVSEAGVHRPHVAGIHGRETDGAYSLVLSGGYEDDVDNGEEFIYTGSGGRDLSGNKRVSAQSSDQTLTRMNKYENILFYLAFRLNLILYFACRALAKNCNEKDWKAGKPVRVVRNYKLGKHSKYAPKEGNRYDGLYKVVKYYCENGKSGFKVWKYVLRRDDPVPPPWENNGKEFDVIVSMNHTFINIPLIHLYIRTHMFHITTMFIVQRWLYCMYIIVTVVIVYICSIRPVT